MRIRTTCPHDCFDTCGMEAEVREGRVTGLYGSGSHEITAGFLCGKVSRYLKRQYSPERILHPLMRKGSTFERVSWEEALDVLASRLASARDRLGPMSALTYTDAGSMGYLKSLETRFWHYFGGATVASGSLCNAAGIAAMEGDYGEIRQHDPMDIPNSRLIILWGRNPSVTNIHMVPLLMRAKRNGCRIISVNPMPSESASLADWQVKPRPGTDAALALAVAAEIFRSGFEDSEFLTRSCEGYAEFRREALSWSLPRASAVTGISQDEIASLARQYSSVKPASIWIGFGMQRHAGGGNAVRAVNALGAVTGNIGIEGGGVNYSNRSSRVLNPLGSFGPEDGVRRIWKGTFAEDLKCLTEPPLEVAFINRSNPLLQAADTNGLERQFAEIPFKAVSEHFMTDTAAQSDLVLPAATFLEEDNLHYSYFHNYVSLSRKVVEPAGEARSDLDIIGDLARRLGYGGHFDRSAMGWIEYSLGPMKPFGIDLDLLKERGWARFPAPAVPWTDRVFKTGTGRLNLSLPEPPSYIEPHEMPDAKMPFYLLSGALRDRLHSQYDNMSDADTQKLPIVYIHPEAAASRGLSDGQEVDVFTKSGECRFELRMDASIRPDVLYAHHGRWGMRGGGVNRLTKGYLTDMGGQGALYDCVAGIMPAEVQ